MEPRAKERQVRGRAVGAGGGRDVLLLDEWGVCGGEYMYPTPDTRYPVGLWG